MNPNVSFLEMLVFFRRKVLKFFRAAMSSDEKIAGYDGYAVFFTEDVKNYLLIVLELFTWWNFCLLFYHGKTAYPPLGRMCLELFQV